VQVDWYIEVYPHYVFVISIQTPSTPSWQMPSIGHVSIYTYNNNALRGRWICGDDEFSLRWKATTLARKSWSVHTRTLRRFVGRRRGDMCLVIAAGMMVGVGVIVTPVRRSIGASDITQIPTAAWPDGTNAILVSSAACSTCVLYVVVAVCSQSLRISYCPEYISMKNQHI
jgi:hypothetical protein